jgi:hypothetical protein
LALNHSTGEWFLDLNGNDKWNGSAVDGLYQLGAKGDLPMIEQWLWPIQLTSSPEFSFAVRLVRGRFPLPYFRTWERK